MTWEDVRALDTSRAVAILPVGAIEAHGPHLPLSTDVLIAEAMARAAAEKLGGEVVLLPPFAYTPAGSAAAFPGTLSMRAEAVTALLVDIARALAAQGIRKLGLANAHLEPAHRACLQAAAEAVRPEIAVAFPDLTRKPWALRLTDEFKSGACHAGQFEGSIVLALRPDLVREDIRRSLPPNPASLSRGLREGKKTFEEMGGPRAYFGTPAGATPEEGRRTIDLLGEILAEAIRGLRP
jgi:creatinine amidohydrolase